MAATNVTISTDSTIIAAFVTAACAQYGYQATINGLPNPQTPGQFAKGVIATFVAQVIQGYQAQQAAQSAQQTAIQTVQSNLTLNPITVT